MAGTGPGVVVKNTFLEVGDHKSLLERHDGWRRQVSEPVKVFAAFNGQAAQDSDFSESDDDVLLGGGMSPAQMESHGAAVSSTHSQKFEASPPLPLNAALSPVVGAQSSAAPLSAAAGSSSSTVGKPPKVLLLSESIPFKRGGEKDREKRGNRDGHINQMKDISITKKEPPWTSVTTVMMRNLPNKYTQQMLLEELQDGGFRLQQDFDFFYLPMDHSNAANLGYCFINFVETALANAFAAAFQGKKMRRFNSNKTVVVMPASVQGYERNYAYYASTRVVQAEDPQYRPLFLRTASDGSTAAAAVPPAAKPNSKGRGAGKGGNAGSGGKDAGGKGKGGGTGGGRAPDGGNARAADWMAPGAGVASAPWPPAAPQQRVCPACNNECMPTHRFCAFCGTDQMSIQANSASMRADAPTFTPSFTAGGNYSQDGNSNGLGGLLQIPLSGAQQGGGQDAGSPWNGLSGSAAIRSPEVITDELDVMRGRMVLLAALRDMEERESFGGDSSRAPGAAAASSRMFPQPPSGTGGSLGSREDFLSVLSR